MSKIGKSIHEHTTDTENGSHFRDDGDPSGSGSVTAGSLKLKSWYIESNDEFPIHFRLPGV